MVRWLCGLLVGLSSLSLAAPLRADSERSSGGGGWSVPDTAWKLLNKPLVTRVLRAVDGPELFLEIFIEHVFAAQPGPVEVKSLLDVPQARVKLTVLECTGQVEVAGSDTSFWGNNRVRVRVPCEHRFEIDLQYLQPADMKYDAKRRLLEIKLPAPIAVRPNLDTTRLEIVEKVNPWFRSRASWLELKDRITGEPLRLEAEAASQALQAEATLKARPMVRDVFQRLMDASKSDVRVVIAE